MKFKTPNGLILVAAFATIAAIGCSRISMISLAQAPTSASVEVVELPEYVGSYLSYKATLRAPVGTVIETERSGTYTMPSTEYMFALTHFMYMGMPAIRPPGEFSAGIDTTYVSSQSAAKILFNPIPNSIEYTNEEPIENYADFPSAGTYPLKEGDQFVLAEIENTIFSVTIVDIPDE